MSWSKSSVRVDSDTDFAALCKQWREEVAAADESNSAGDVITNGHAEQIDVAVVAIEALANAFDPRRPLMVSAYGHASTEGSGNVGVSYSPTE